MSEQDESENTQFLKPHKTSFFARLRNDFLAGIVVAAPLGITVWLLYLLITGPIAGLDELVKRFTPERFIEQNVLEYLPGAGVILAIMALVLLGALAKNFIGRSVINLGERFVDSMPVVRNLYGFFKNVFEMALQQSERSFKEVALVEYPRKGTWVMAFVVTSTKGEIKHKLSDCEDELISIFVPTTPNPTSGFLLFAPASDLRKLEMTVEEGAKLIFSAGLVTPAYDPGDYTKKLEELANEAGSSGKDKKKLRDLFKRNDDNS